VLVLALILVMGGQRHAREFELAEACNAAWRIAVRAEDGEHSLRGRLVSPGAAPGAVFVLLVPNGLEGSSSDQRAL